MLKAFDSYLDGHGHLRVFAEDADAAKEEYARLYALPEPEMASYAFSAVEADPRTTPRVEEFGWAQRRRVLGTLGSERKLTDAARPKAATETPPPAPPKPTETPAATGANQATTPVNAAADKTAGPKTGAESKKPAASP